MTSRGRPTKNVPNLEQFPTESFRRLAFAPPFAILQKVQSAKLALCPLGVADEVRLTTDEDRSPMQHQLGNSPTAHESKLAGLSEVPAVPAIILEKA